MLTHELISNAFVAGCEAEFYEIAQIVQNRPGCWISIFRTSGCVVNARHVGELEFFLIDMSLYLEVWRTSAEALTWLQLTLCL